MFLHFFWRDSGDTKNFFFQIQNEFIFGLVVWNINKKFLEKALEIKPNLISIYRGICIFPTSLQVLKENIGYFNFYL